MEDFQPSASSAPNLRDMLAALAHKGSTASGRAHKQLGGIPGLRQQGVVVNVAVSVEGKLLRHSGRTTCAFV